MQNLPNQSQNVLEAINTFYEKNYYFPTAKDLLKTLKLKETMIYLYFAQLKKEKLITRNKKGHIIATSSYPILPSSHV